MHFIRFITSFSLITLTSCSLKVASEATALTSKPSNSNHPPLQNVQQASVPSSCPEKGGGGNIIALFTTENFYIYICQGGTGRADWRELDYYGVNRKRPNESLRLRAIVRQQGYYAVNGTTRYDINSSFLRVTQDGKTLLQERVNSCEGNPTSCDKL